MSLLGRQSPDERDERLGGSRMVSAASKEENIYIPQFITKRPFYTIDEADEEGSAGGEDGGVGTASLRGSRDYLEHQRLRKKEEESAIWQQRQAKRAGPAATKYRRGACENCGSMGHKKRDCLERPRAKLAKHTGQDIQADDVVQDALQGWDAKRDRWAGFDARDYAAIVARREALTEARRALQERVAGGGGGGGGGSGTPADENEDTRYAEDADMGVSRTNGAADLRMREDTARYLINLDLDSAKYDPKRRKIVSGGAFLDASAQLFAEQNFAKTSGDAAALEKAERYAWEIHDQTGDSSLHVQANPTAAAHQRRLEAEAARREQQALDELMREKYGVAPSETVDEGVSSSNKTQKVLAASEAFVEYDETGHVKERLQAHRADRSKYAEDVLPMNHASVWGSWWHDFHWGYACCHSFVRNSYCTGEEGKAAWERAERQRLGDWDEPKQITAGDEGREDESREDTDDGSRTKTRRE